MVDKDVKDILKKYSRKIGEEMHDFDGAHSRTATGGASGEGVSQEFLQFKKDMMPELSKYEKWDRC